MASSVKAPTGPALVKNEPKSKTKPSRVLPFDRVTFTKQLEIVRAYAAASAQGTRSVPNTEVAATIKMAVETISSCNAFLSSIGLIQKSGVGWIVSAEVQAFFRAFDWNKETASHKLAPLIQAAWFFQGLQSKLSFRSLEEEDAISDLADLATAGPEYKKALKMLIDWLEASGLVQRDGSQLRLRTMSTKSETNSTQEETTKSAESAADSGPPRPKVVTAFSQTVQGTMPQGAMRFNVSFDMDLAEIATWSPDRIAAFFNGIAQVLAAKAEVEKTAGL